MTTEKPHGKEIIAALGGPAAVARILEISERTVWHWSNTGVIPEKYRETLVRYAKENGIAHKPEDYIAHLMNI